MAVYFIGDVRVQDASAYEDYRRATTDLIARHGGRYLVRGGDFEVISGGWRPRRLIVVEFPDQESARGYLNDPEFAAMAELRQRALKSDIVMVKGVEADAKS
jgi:uncharacterized protein (DUF1330 family)